MMRHLSRVAALLLVLCAGLPADARPRTVKQFIHNSGAAVGQQQFLGRFRVPARLGKLLGKVKFVAKRMRTRKVIQVTNKTLGSYVNSTKKGYLEVVVPANKGHVFFRYGKEVFDFYPKGFRVGAATRPNGSERYGMLIPLNKKQERKIQRYLKRLKKSGGKELGKYDFHGEGGFHCVTWMMRLAMAGKQHGGSKDLAQWLGGRKKDGSSMPRFSRFMLKKAAPVEAVVVYNSGNVKSRSELSRMAFDIMSSRQLRRANRQMNREQAIGYRP